MASAGMERRQLRPVDDEGGNRSGRERRVTRKTFTARPAEERSQDRRGKTRAGGTASGAEPVQGHRRASPAKADPCESRPAGSGAQGTSNRREPHPGHAPAVSHGRPVRKAHSLIDKVYLWKNLWTAWRKVRANKGAHGLDRVTIHMYETQCEIHLREIQRKLKERRYTPEPVRRVYIPKASDPKKKRPLGIPTVNDRIVQQAILQVVEPLFDDQMSPRSFGFRKGRRAHGAIATLVRDAKNGYRCVVDADIASFFDRIDHDVVMSRVRARIADGRVLDLIEAFLAAGVAEDGEIVHSTEGTPQGGVISPWLSNLVLDDLDKAIEAKGWPHVRYADDFVVLTRSPEEAEEALAFVKEVLGELKLSLHETKTRLTDFREGFEFLGFRFRRYRLGVRPASIEKFKARIRTVTRRQQGRNVDAVLADLNPILRGWSGYFGVAEVTALLTKLDRWIRMRIRAFRFKRKRHTDNWRLPNRRLRKWGLLSLTACRPEQRLSYVGAGSQESGTRPLAMRNPHGVAQCGNSAC